MWAALLAIVPHRRRLDKLHHRVVSNSVGQPDGRKHPQRRPRRHRTKTTERNQ